MDNGFFKMPNKLIDNDILMQISCAALKVYTLLNRMRNNNTNESWPSYKYIQDKTGLSSASIAKAIKEIQILGLVKVDKSEYHNQYKTITDIKYKNTSKTKVVKPLQKVKQVTSKSKVEPLQNLKSNKTNRTRLNNKTMPPEGKSRYGCLTLTEADYIDELVKLGLSKIDIDTIKNDKTESHVKNLARVWINVRKRTFNGKPLFELIKPSLYALYSDKFYIDKGKAHIWYLLDVDNDGKAAMQRIRDFSKQGGA